MLRARWNSCGNPTVPLAPVHGLPRGRQAKGVGRRGLAATASADLVLHLPLRTQSKEDVRPSGERAAAPPAPCRLPLASMRPATGLSEAFTSINQSHAHLPRGQL